MTTSEPTARGRAAAQSLVEVHDTLRTELQQVRGLVGAVASRRLDPEAARGELQRLALRRHDWTTGAYCAAHCLTVAQHHHGEDHEIFPALRRGQPSLGPVLDRLEAEHVTIHTMLERLDEALVVLVENGPGEMTALDQALQKFSATLLAHLDYEEGQLLTPMSEVFG